MMNMIEAGQKVLTREVVENIRTGTYKDMISEEVEEE